MCVTYALDTTVVIAMPPTFGSRRVFVGVLLTLCELPASLSADNHTIWVHHPL